MWQASGFCLGQGPFFCGGIKRIWQRGIRYVSGKGAIEIFLTFFPKPLDFIFSPP